MNEHGLLGKVTAPPAGLRSRIAALERENRSLPAEDDLVNRVALARFPKADMNGSLANPFDIREVAAALDHLVKNRRRPVPVAANAGRGSPE